MNKSGSQLSVGVTACAVFALALVGCGGAVSSSSNSTVSGAPVAAVQPAVGDQAAKPNEIVARIGPYSITGAVFNRELLAEVNHEPASERLVAPEFTACVAHLQRELAHAPDGTPGPSALLHTCQVRYDAVRKRVMDRLISGYWLIGGARELGVATSDRAVNAYFDRHTRKNLATDAQLRSFLAGRSLADALFETRVELDADATGRAVDDRVGAATEAQVAAYYAKHKSRYVTVVAARDLNIVRTATAAQAMRAKREVVSGKSFAQVVKRIGGTQSAFSNNGFVRELIASQYTTEPSLHDAIFATKPRVLHGPIGTRIGYFVFEVTHIRPPRYKPLTAVASSIRRDLRISLQRQARADFIKRGRAKWAAKTDCRPEYVVPKCRQFNGLSIASPEDSYTIG